MATLEKTRLPESSSSTVRTARISTSKTRIASALAGRPIHLPKTTILDVVLEKRIIDPNTVMPFLTGYQKASELDVIKALRAGPGHKIGTVLGGTQASDLLLAVRQIGGDLTFRINDKSIPIGDETEPDLRLASITMMGCTRFTEDDAWLVCEMAGYDETPEQLSARIQESSWEIVNVIEQVPLPAAAATHDLLRTSGYSNVTVRQAVPRKK